jgi:hypothetical protein
MPERFVADAPIGCADAQRDLCASFGFTPIARRIPATTPGLAPHDPL